MYVALWSVSQTELGPISGISTTGLTVDIEDTSGRNTRDNRSIWIICVDPKGEE
jgi:hypothetical protein